ncbi:hypothetical protein E3O44_03670 [Cryobacterium algoricola]|uniref:Secreted protein n=2 Tax=Cryobacterium algoricola TaxID=1259183 RepID=A0ABY2IGK9_9MICO|nr:hypothetical protein E3O44_03670 [Cryobacterium algoricola]
MPIRITSTSTKIAYVVASCVVFMLGAALAIGLPSSAIPVVAGVLALIVVGFAVRTFRGEGEPVEQRRPWWKMTARPTSGFVFALLFGSQAIYVLLTFRGGSDSASSIIPIVVDGLIATMFALSSLRLGALDRTTASEKQ